METKKISHYLDSSDRDLQYIFKKAAHLKELNARITPLLPANIRPYCQIANINQDTLILLCANASVATQLRFSSPELIKQFNQLSTLSMIKKIEYLVRPVTTPPDMTPQENMDLLSKETAQTIQEIADALSDPDLKAVMEKIATRVKE